MPASQKHLQELVGAFTPGSATFADDAKFLRVVNELADYPPVDVQREYFTQQLRTMWDAVDLGLLALAIGDSALQPHTRILTGGCATGAELLEAVGNHMRALDRLNEWLDELRTHLDILQLESLAVRGLMSNPGPEVN